MKSSLFFLSRPIKNHCNRRKCIFILKTKRASYIVAFFFIASLCLCACKSISNDYTIKADGTISNLSWGCTSDEWLAAADKGKIDYTIVEDGLNKVISVSGSFLGVPAELTLIFINSDSGKTLRSVTVVPDTEENAAELRNQFDDIFGARCEESVTESGTLYPLDEQHKFWHSPNCLDELLDDDEAEKMLEIGYSQPRLKYLYPVMICMQKDDQRRTVFEIDAWLVTLLSSLGMEQEV